jgi:hypothetical protein
MDYRFKPVGKTCTATGRDLVPGSVCYSSLVERNGQLTRLDFSEEGWPGPREDELGHWRSIVPFADDIKARPLDADALMRQFEQLSEDANPGRENLVYVLALLLLQKRRLKLADSTRDGETEYLTLTGIRGEGPYHVRDQRLSNDEIVKLQRELNAHLSAGPE